MSISQEKFITANSSSLRRTIRNIPCGKIENGHNKQCEYQVIDAPLNFSRVFLNFWEQFYIKVLFLTTCAKINQNNC